MRGLERTLAVLQEAGSPAAMIGAMAVATRGIARSTRDVIERAGLLEVAGSSVRVARAADLVLLKLYAGGPTDRWDIERLLEIAADRSAFIGAVEAELPRLPPECRTPWERILGDAR